MTRIPANLRQQVIERANGLCEYCQSALIIVVTMEVDHIVPQSVGGETTLDNLCLACRGCNGFKQDFLTAIDPVTQQEVALFNPRLHVWSEHFAWREDGIVINGLTPSGRATIDRLRMNRDSIVASRRLWVQAGWHPPKLGQFPLS